MDERPISPMTLVVILIAIAVTILFIAVLVEMPGAGFSMGVGTPRPTLPLVTPTHFVYLPKIDKDCPTVTETPRPTLESR